MTGNIDAHTRADGVVVRYIYSACVVTGTADIRILLTVVINRRAEGESSDL
jgi:hypothetical protein